MRWMMACTVIAFGAICAAAQVKSPSATPDFNREVRPILANHCFKCHGPDDKQRMAGLRLDVRDSALAPQKSGKRAIVPGKPVQSEVIRRIFSSGTLLMPPAHANKPLTESKKQILQRWIESGAKYDAHWAFEPPLRPALPRIQKPKSKIQNPIDSFVSARLAKEGMTFSPVADRYTLARRVYIDLIGLPPTPEELEAYLSDPSDRSYENLVDKLLASPHYGERWARKWLDLARYADTNGFEKDRPRSIWPYRDWVINALNTDMPFDQFTIEQIAGDMLPNATESQRIATGFHRNTMLNEEGGIDPLEYRFYSVVDRVATTGTTWLGITVACAQCHTHKFDPITQREYYQFLAFLNNADEPEIEIEKPEITTRRREIESKIAALEADLPNRFPAPSGFEWSTGKVSTVTSSSGSTATVEADGSVLVSGKNPETDLLSLAVIAESGADVIRVVALTHPSLGGKGPGRTPHGNFVLSELTLAGEDQAAIKIMRAEADFSQEGFPASNAVDGNVKTGWAIHGPGQWNVNRNLTLHLEKPLESGRKLLVKLNQNHGSQHTLGHLRILFGKRVSDDRPMEIRRRENLDREFAKWLKPAESKAVTWISLKPAAAKANVPLLTLLDDNSIIASGDQTKRDVYDIAFRGGLKGVTAIRIEAIPDSRLPNHGPGRVAYEGPIGDFFLSEVGVTSDGAPVKITQASASFGSGAAGMIDGDPQTGWSINGGQNRAHTAVFNLAAPIGSRDYDVRLLFERYYAGGLGRFRISVTGDTIPAEAGPPPHIEAILRNPANRTDAGLDALKRYFLSISPEIKSERDEIAKLRGQIPAYSTTLVFTERPPENPRSTHVHRRGEFLQPGIPVNVSIPSVLAAGSRPPRNRLEFARWLVDRRNPLTARVIMNRQWAAFFGRGLVRTVEDFGYQGEAPTHPELLDWLAVEFMEPSRESASVRSPGSDRSRPPTAWGLKRMHKLIVMSATYRQSSRVTPGLLRKDPGNVLLARGPRVRLEAEMLRDNALTASGLLSRKMGGPSVYPPQEPGITTQGVYGPLEWKVSQGEDRYRRGLYTFAKRTAPYASFMTFDGISGEACTAKREVSNTPLQALTALNDPVFVEAAQALGQLISARSESVDAKAEYLFRRCLTRPPTSIELTKLVSFFRDQKTRFDSGELKAESVAGAGENAAERATWTSAARVLLNLDESVTKG